MKEAFGTLALIFIPVILITVAFILIAYFTDNFEGIASIGILILAIVALCFFKGEVVENKYTVLVFVGVFVFFGLVFDRAGNVIYNKPFQMMCPAETVLTRDVVAVENSDGEMVNQQYFSCYSITQGKVVKELPVYQTIGIRVLEYVVIGFVLVGIYWLIFRFVISRKK
jgi:hypothetical protein